MPVPRVHSTASQRRPTRTGAIVGDRYELMANPLLWKDGEGYDINVASLRNGEAIVRALNDNRSLFRRCRVQAVYSPRSYLIAKAAAK